MPAEPIRDRAHVDEIKRQLRDAGRLRDYVIFACGMNWALRVSDLLRLRVGDVQNGLACASSSRCARRRRTSPCVSTSPIAVARR